MSALPPPSAVPDSVDAKLSSPTPDDLDDFRLACRYGDLEDVITFLARFPAAARAADDAERREFEGDGGDERGERGGRGGYGICSDTRCERGAIELTSRDDSHSKLCDKVEVHPELNRNLCMIVKCTAIMTFGSPDRSLTCASHHHPLTSSPFRQTMSDATNIGQSSNKRKRACDYCKAKRVICHPHPDGCPRCREKGVQCVSSCISRAG